MTRVDKLFPASWLLSVIFFVSVILLHKNLDRQTTAAIKADQVIVPSFNIVELCALGYERFLADLYWLAFVQYTGDREVLITDRYQHAFDYVDLITRLDPYFQQPYWFGCWAIGSMQKRPDLADGIMQRGMKANPTNWYMPFMAGVNQYLYAHNYKAAAAYYLQASKLPGAPAYVARHAAILESPVPEYEKRVRTLLQLYASAKEPNLKDSAKKELISVLKDMYHQSPVETVKAASKNLLSKLDVDPAEIAKLK